jgi:NAD(P)-dependent dehydrogenase (short-subunit alcohol dehydrogenase family)
VHAEALDVKDLRGRVAVVTGAASGIGRSLAGRFAAEGMKVMLADVDGAALDDAVHELEATGAEVAGTVVDVTRSDQVLALADRTLETFGAAHVVCNNAGVDSGGSFTEIPEKVWEWVFAVNFWGVLYGCSSFLPLMRRQAEGHLVNVASHAALTGYFPAGTPYVASKFAVLGLSENLYHELKAAAEPIGVSVLCPSFVRTNLPLSERNRPADVPSMDANTAWQAHLEANRTRSATGLQPEQVAGHVIEAIQADRFYILTSTDKSIAAVRQRERWIVDGTPPRF